MPFRLFCYLKLYKSYLFRCLLPSGTWRLKPLFTAFWMKFYMAGVKIVFFLHLNLQSINPIELYSFSHYLQLSCSTSRYMSRYKRLTARGEDQYTVRIDDTSRLYFKVVVFLVAKGYLFKRTTVWTGTADSCVFQTDLLHKWDPEPFWDEITVSNERVTDYSIMNCEVVPCSMNHVMNYTNN